ncbi:hypothetical protein EDB82DRAFT_284319 [Fusarium venenatum]|uniref:uncharacterized protein n=1 Tax=Fusarium venenatum TaxID=56646 RepID=UPI001DC01E0C|nr:hypothetical protein EDB82DRAFT_284319 [Fusarium venenatum]
MRVRARSPRKKAGVWLHRFLVNKALAVGDCSIYWAGWYKRGCRHPILVTGSLRADPLHTRSSLFPCSFTFFSV